VPSFLIPPESSQGVLDLEEVLSRGPQTWGQVARRWRAGDPAIRKENCRNAPRVPVRWRT